MTKLKLGLVWAVLLIFGWMLPLSANAQSDTQMGASFTPSTSVTTAQQITEANRHIPAGNTVHQKVTPTATNSNGQLTGQLQKTLCSGRLPQTAEAYAWYVRIVGGLLLLVLILSYLLWRDAKADKRGWA